MKKCILVGLCLLLFSLSACRMPQNYTLMNDEKDVSDISIVGLSFDEAGELVQTERKKVEEIQTFLRDFREVDCYIYFGDPTGVMQGGADAEAVVIKISYTNGEYELINWNGQAKNTLEYGFDFYNGFAVFEFDQFVDLIDKYKG